MTSKVSSSSPRPAPRRGLTLIELIITLAIGLILLAIAVPQMSAMIARQRVVALAKELKNNVSFARTSTLESNISQRLGFESNADLTCYVIYPDYGSTGKCNCTITSGAMCPSNISGGNPNYVQRLVVLKRSSGITITADGRYLIYSDLISSPTVNGFVATRPAAGH
jgi:prepilin-type N-terminal cleavage/methylation domain-containing protein